MNKKHTFTTPIKNAGGGGALGYIILL